MSESQIRPHMHVCTNRPLRYLYPALQVCNKLDHAVCWQNQSQKLKLATTERHCKACTSQSIYAHSGQCCTYYRAMMKKLTTTSFSYTTSRRHSSKLTTIHVLDVDGVILEMEVDRGAEISITQAAIYKQKLHHIKLYHL